MGAYDNWRTTEPDYGPCGRCGRHECMCGDPVWEADHVGEVGPPEEDERDPRELEAERETAAEPRPHILIELEIEGDS